MKSKYENMMQIGQHNGYKVGVLIHSTHTISYMKPRLCKYQNCLEWVGSCFAMLALGSLRDMVLDIVVLQLVDLMLAVCVR